MIRNISPSRGQKRSIWCFIRHGISWNTSAKKMIDAAPTNVSSRMRKNRTADRQEEIHT